MVADKMAASRRGKTYNTGQPAQGRSAVAVRIGNGIRCHRRLTVAERQRCIPPKTWRFTRSHAKFEGIHRHAEELACMGISMGLPKMMRRLANK
jgi:hypothetical protein